MAQEFLEQLLLVENCVKINEDEALTCMVCLEPYQTLNASTGAVELQVRLPCKHLVGSVCIATWLQDNNSCPLCRAIFFPAQPRPYLEHGLLDDVESPISESYDTLDPEEICENLCEELDLDEEIKDISYRISALMSYRLREQVHSSECNAATSVYIAWHLLNTDIDDMVTDFLTDLSVAAHVGEDLILSTWRQFYPNRMEVIAPQVLSGLARPHSKLSFPEQVFP